MLAKRRQTRSSTSLRVGQRDLVRLLGRTFVDKEFPPVARSRRCVYGGSATVSLFEMRASTLQGNNPCHSSTRFSNSHAIRAANHDEQHRMDHRVTLLANANCSSSSSDGSEVSRLRKVAELQRAMQRSRSPRKKNMRLALQHPSACAPSSTGTTEEEEGEVLDPRGCRTLGADEDGPQTLGSISTLKIATRRAPQPLE